LLLLTLVFWSPLVAAWLTGPPGCTCAPGPGTPARIEAAAG
jgi:hypothetical protein